MRRDSLSAAACFAFLAMAPSASGAEVELSLSSSITYGDPVVLYVEVVNAPGGAGVPVVPPVAGLKIKGPYGPTRQFTSINGVTRNALVYQYQVEPLSGRYGTFKIGPVRVPLGGGGELQSPIVELGVYRKPPPGCFLEVRLEKREGDVGEPFRVKYVLGYPYTPARRRSLGFFDDDGGGVELNALEFPLLEHPGIKVRAIEVQGRGSGVVDLGGRRIPYRQGFEARDDGAGYRTLEFEFEVVPLRTGKIELGGARAAMTIPTGETVIRRDLFGRRYRTEERKRFEAEAPSAAYTVHPLPEAGRPRGFTGAIGRFQIEVSTKDTSVAAYDPIRLEIRVRGEGLLEELAPPSWKDIPELTRDFDISSDVDAGKIEGDTKIFRQVIRPRHERVTEIPAIPFPYYDPWRKRYEVARSKPIPIRVRAAKTVGGDAAVVKHPQVMRPVATEAAPILEEVGVQANFTEIGVPVRGLTPRERILDPGFLALLGIPPLAFGLFAAGLALVRADPERRAKRQAIRAARRALETAEGDPERLLAGYEDYLRAAFGLPGGELVPGDVEERLREAGIGVETAGEAAHVLDRLAAWRFGGQELEGGLEAVLETVRKLEKERTA